MNRRDFIQALTGAALAPTLPPIPKETAIEFTKRLLADLSPYTLQPTMLIVPPALYDTACKILECQ